ncbi:O-antigen polysaccharide polymerase Wzy [Pedobacter steynii]|nr:O-antigen polysaccharide polymerase Wzy [Pedobacter steynii]
MFVFILLIEYVSLIFFDDLGDGFLKLLEGQLLVIYLFAIFFAIRLVGLWHLFTMFLLTFGLFLLSRPILDVLGYQYSYIVESLVQVDVPMLIRIEIVMVLSCSILIFQICFLYFVRFEDVNFSLPSLKTDQNLISLGKFLMISSSPLVLFRSYQQIMLIKTLGYGALFSGEVQQADMNPIVRLSITFFSIGYYFIIGGKPSKKKFIGYSFFYLGLSMLNLIIGSRMGIVLNVLFILWYLHAVYGQKFKFKKIFLYFTVAIICLQVVALKRISSEVDMGIGEMIFSFFSFQGISMITLAIYIQYGSTFVAHTVPYVLDPLYYGINVIFNPWLLRAGQSVETIAVRSDFGHHLTYSMNENYYLSGFSLGTSFISELYEFGIFGVLFGCVLLTWLITYFSRKVKVSKYLLIFSMLIVSHVLSTPRGNFFYNTYILFRLILMMIIIYYIYILFKKIKNQLSTNGQKVLD